MREKVVIIVCSTTGDGDPPDNAAKFVRFLRKKSLANDILKNLKFTVLGKEKGIKIQEKGKKEGRNTEALLL